MPGRLQDLVPPSLIFIFIFYYWNLNFISNPNGLGAIFFFMFVALILLWRPSEADLKAFLVAIVVKRLAHEAHDAELVRGKCGHVLGEHYIYSVELHLVIEADRRYRRVDAPAFVCRDIRYTLILFSFDLLASLSCCSIDGLAQWRDLR